MTITSGETKTIVNIDYLGRCYDVVDMDPLNLGTTAKFANAIKLDATETSQTDQGSWAVPKGVHHMTPWKMRFDNLSSVVSSSYDFQEDFKRSVEVSAGVEGVFEFSGSASFKEITQRTESRKNSFVYTRLYQENHLLALDLDNAKAPLEVTPEFREAVEQLPFQEGNWEPEYRNFIHRFGTHFTNEIALGGLAFQRTSGSSKTFLVSKQTEETLTASANIQLKQIDAGVTTGQAKTNAAKVDSEQSLTRNVLEF